MLDRERVAELIVTNAEGGRSRGSGYLVDDRVVLTAAHVVSSAVSVYVRLAPDLPAERTLEAGTWWADAESDLAVVSVAGAGGAAGRVRAVEFGRLLDRAAVLTVQAVGFPLWKMRNADGTVPDRDDGKAKFRDTYHVVGTTALLSNWREGTLEVVVPAPPATPVDTGSPWEGMSGAPLWVGDRIVGVIARHHPGDGLSRLAAVRLDRALAGLDPARLAELRQVVPAIPADPAAWVDVVPPSIGEFTLGGYRAQLVDIAPDQLHGRDTELDELVRFCAGDEPVGWWQAGPWAGKTALLSWFALHPPAGVDVVSFFITRRFSGQSDSDAFTEVLLEQLAALCGEPMQEIRASRNRSGQLMRLLDLAAARARAGGRRLLLVVDGLDEDTSRSSEPVLPSVASLLPRRPPVGLRILLASRPHPDLPGDVRDDHLLRTVATQPLSKSGYARAIKFEAQEELTQLLRGPVLGREVAGLITASGGGLTRPDLEQLTGHAPFELDPLLGGLFGRSISGRVNPTGTDGDTERVYMFAHETLRVTAEQQFGTALTGYRDRIHTWADDYCARGWPPDTPMYLLRGYTQLFTTVDDPVRLRDIALDQARHDRQFARTGGDALALTELTTAAGRIRHQEPPDLATLLRLSLVRDNIVARNSDIPIELLAVWVRLGQPDRAIALAAGITDTVRRGWALAGLVDALAQTGQHDRAQALAELTTTTANDIGEPSLQASVITGLVPALAQAGQHDRAEALADLATTTAREITSPTDRALSLARLAAALIQAGQHDRAHALADLAATTATNITHPYLRAQTLTRSAMALAQAGQHDRALALADLAITTADNITDTFFRASVLAELVAVLAQSGRDDRALADLAVTATYEIAEPSLRDSALVDLVDALAQSGQHDRAEHLAHDITRATNRARALARLADALAQAGQLDRAEHLAHDIIDPAYRAQALAELASVRARVGHHDRAHALAELATATARDITALSYSRVDTIAGLLVALAWAGQHDRAHALAELATATTRSTSESWTLFRLVDALAKAGQHDRAERLAHEITDPTDRTRALTALVTALARAGQHDRSHVLADMAITAAHDIINPVDHARALVRLVSAQAWAGQHDRAEHLAHDIIDPAYRTQALAALVTALAQAGQHDRAHALLELATTAASEITLQYDHARALVELVSAQAWAGQHDRAEHLAHDITDPTQRAQALTALVTALAQAGQHDRAEHLAHDITDPTQRAQALTALVTALAQAGQHDRAHALAELATTVAHDITDSSQLGSLAALGWALVGGDRSCPACLTLAIRLSAEVAATWAWLAVVNVIARCAPQELDGVVDDVFGHLAMTPDSGIAERG